MLKPHSVSSGNKSFGSAISPQGWREKLWHEINDFLEPSRGTFFQTFHSAHPTGWAESSPQRYSIRAYNLRRVGTYLKPWWLTHSKNDDRYLTLVTLFRSYNQFYRAECITVSGFLCTMYFWSLWKKVFTVRVCSTNGRDLFVKCIFVLRYYAFLITLEG